MGNFPQHFPQEFPARFSHKISHKIFPARISCKNFPQDFPVIFYHNNFPQDFPKLDPDWLAPHHPIPNAKFPPITACLKLAFPPPPCPTRISCKNFPQDFPARFSRKNFPQEFPTRFSHKIFQSWILIGWLPITLFQMLNFHQSLPFLNWLFPLLLVPQEFTERISHKIFPQNFPTRIFCKIFPQDFPKLDPDWLFPHHPIPNAKFPPITALLNRPTYHQRSKVSPPPLPQILWESQINE